MQLRRERFIEELESYTKQMEEFHLFGDMQEINRYLKKAQALDAKLQAAADKVCFFQRPCQQLLCNDFFPPICLCSWLSISNAWRKL